MPEHTTRLLVIRHGETAWNTEGRIQGHIDIPLNDKGRWQAERLAQALAGEELHAIYSSDLQRARHTAEAVASAMDIELNLHTGLRERHFGRLEGHTQAEVAEKWPDEGRRWRQRDPSYGPEGGETLQAFYDRSVSVLTALAEQHMGQSIAVVAHGGVLDCFYRAANRLPIEAQRTWKVGNACVNRLLYSPEGFAMLAWADDRHLDEDSVLDEATDGATNDATGGSTSGLQPAWGLSAR
jgi:probable phosphoglycerate mutase